MASSADPGLALLTGMVGFWDARNYAGTGTWVNLGTAGTAGDMILGAATAAPTFSGSGNPAKFAFDGVNDVMATAGNVTQFDAPIRTNNFTIGVIMSWPNTVSKSVGTIFAKDGTAG